MRWRYLWVVILVFLSLSPLAAQEQDFSNVDITATRVNGNVYLLPGGYMRGNDGPGDAAMLSAPRSGRLAMTPYAMLWGFIP